MKAWGIGVIVFVLWINPLFAENNRITLDSSEGSSVGLEFKIPFGKQYSYDDILVAKVIDGDTAQLENGERIRLLGIDTPEVYHTKESQEKALRKGTDVEAIRVLGKKATAFTRELMEGKRVRLVFDAEKRDKYNRLLAYVFIDYSSAIDITKAEGDYFICNGIITSLFCNATIVKSGYARPMTILPNLMYADLFRTLDREAREHKRGLWK